MNNNQPLAKTIITSSNLSVSMNESANLLKVNSPITFWGELIVSFAILLVVSCILIMGNTTSIENNLLIILVATFGLMLLFVFSLMKRSSLSIFDLAKGVLFHHKGGIYSSRLDESDQEIKLTDISRVSVQKFLRRYGDTFQVFLVVKTATRIKVTDASLSLADAQLCAETIRGFLNIQRKN